MIVKVIKVSCVLNHRFNYAVSSFCVWFWCLWNFCWLFFLWSHQETQRLLSEPGHLCLFLWFLILFWYLVFFVRRVEFSVGDLWFMLFLFVFVWLCYNILDLMMQRRELVRLLRKTICGISMWWSLAQLSLLMKVVMILRTWFYT